MTSRKRKAAVLALVMVLAILAGCSASSDPNQPGEAAGVHIKDIVSEPVKIAFITTTFGGLLSISEMAADEVKSAYPNLTINFFNGEFNPSVQNAAINECITQKYDAIILEALDPTALINAVREAEENGIAVITLNDTVDTVHSLWYKNSGFSAGMSAAEGLVNAMGGRGNVMIYDVPQEVVMVANFSEGFKAYIADFPDVQIVEHQYSQFNTYTQEGAFTAVSDMLTKHSDVQGIFCTQDDLALGAVQAVSAAGRENEGIKIWGLDLQPCGIEAIRNGTMAGTCFSERFTTYFTIFTHALSLIQTGTTAVNAGYDATPVIYTSYKIVDAENLESMAPLARWP